MLARAKTLALFCLLLHGALCMQYGEFEGWVAAHSCQVRTGWRKRSMEAWSAAGCGRLHAWQHRDKRVWRRVIDEVKAVVEWWDGWIRLGLLC